MQNLFDHNTLNWHISRHSQSCLDVEDVCVPRICSDEALYTSNYVWGIEIRELKLKTELGVYFEDFFCPMKELFAIILFWDCTGNNIFISKASPIYISKNNSRKLHASMNYSIRKGITGALITQLYVLEYKSDWSSFFTSLPSQQGNWLNLLNGQISNGCSFDETASFLTQSFFQNASMYGVEGVELHRSIHPSFQLKRHPIIERIKKTPFYNLVIRIRS